MSQLAIYLAAIYFGSFAVATSILALNAEKWEGMFAWFDIWVGIFIDRKSEKIYLFPIPCFGLVFDFKRKGMALTELKDGVSLSSRSNLETLDKGQWNPLGI